MSQNSRPKVYLAGPDVFYPNALARLNRHLEKCAALGLQGLIPVDNEVVGGTPREQALGIYRGNLAKMQQADGVIANITPFRGPHMDPGTAFEIGFFVAQGKPVVCYSTDPSVLAERVRKWSRQSEEEAATVDKNGALIEDFGFVENLMIEGSVIDRGLGHGISPEQVLTCFKEFDSAVRAMLVCFGDQKQYRP